MAFIAPALPWISAAFAGIGTGMSVIGQVGASRQQSQMAAIQAKAQEEQAGQLQALGEIEYAKKKQEGEKLLSKQRAGYAASGVELGSGSPLTVMEETAAEIERDALLGRWRYEAGANQAMNTSAAYSAQGNVLKSALPWTVGKTLLTGAVRTANPFIKRYSWSSGDSW